MMKYWEHIIDNNLSFDRAKEQIEKYKPYYATRPCWGGVHFYSKQGEYCILLKDGNVMINALAYVWSKDEDDWMIVTISDEAVKILEDNGLLQYTSKDMHIKVNENETLLQFIRNSEKEFGMNVACLGSMTDKEFNDYIDFLDGLWCK